MKAEWYDADLGHICLMRTHGEPLSYNVVITFDILDHEKTLDKQTTQTYTQ